jgi:mono/diheme cytochrome c family protein
VSALQARDPEVRVENLEHGRSLYLQKCSSCHRLYEPASLSPDAWPDKVAGMQREGRVHLTDEELTDMLRYLRATSLVARR